MIIQYHFYTFLLQWLSWAEADAQTNQFLHMGLCSNFDLYLETLSADKLARLDELNITEDAISNFLGEQFNHSPYPFSPTSQTFVDDANFYSTESTRQQMHKNPLRLAWVKQYIQFYENKDETRLQNFKFIV